MSKEEKKEKKVSESKPAPKPKAAAKYYCVKNLKADGKQYKVDDEYKGKNAAELEKKGHVEKR